MRLVLDPTHADIQRQQGERIGRRILAAVLEYVGRDERGGNGSLSAREAIMRSTLEPQARIVPWVGRARVKMYLPAVADAPAMISESMPCHIVLPKRVSAPSQTAPPISATVRAPTRPR